MGATRGCMGGASPWGGRWKSRWKASESWLLQTAAEALGESSEAWSSTLQLKIDFG